MKVFSKISIFILTLVLGLSSLSSVSLAAVQPTVTAATISGDRIQLRVTADPNSLVRLVFLRPGASVTTELDFGTTDASGLINTVISSGTYGISPGAQVRVVVNGVASADSTWPAYVGSLSLNYADIVTLAPGQNTVVTASARVYIAFNTNSSVVNAVADGTRITLSALARGTSKVTLCGAEVGCKTLNVTVQDESSTRITLSQDVVTLRPNQTATVTVSGDAANNYYISNNANTSLVSTAFGSSGSSNILSLTATASNASGTAVITICSRSGNIDCALLRVQVISNATIITFSENPIVVQVGQTKTISLSGGSGRYYVASNAPADSIFYRATIDNTNLQIQARRVGTREVKVCTLDDVSNCSTASVRIVAAPPLPPTFPTLPAVPSANIYQTRQLVVLSWTPDPQFANYSGFTIYRSETAGTIGQLIGRVNKTESLFADVKAKQPGMYYYTILYYWDNSANANNPQTSVRVQ